MLPALVSAFIQKYRTSKILFIGLFLISIAYTFSPIAFTFKTYDGPAKLVTYCKMRTPFVNKEDSELAMQMQENGECIVSSCFGSSFSAEKYIIW